MIDDLTENQRLTLGIFAAREAHPDAVTIEMVAEARQCSRSTAERLMREGVADGRLIWCWARTPNGRWKRAVRLSLEGEIQGEVLEPLKTPAHIRGNRDESPTPGTATGAGNIARSPNSTTRRRR